MTKLSERALLGTRRSMMLQDPSLVCACTLVSVSKVSGRPFKVKDCKVMVGSVISCELFAG